MLILSSVLSAADSEGTVHHILSYVRGIVVQEIPKVIRHAIKLNMAKCSGLTA
jgi:hypothetical protein